MITLWLIAIVFVSSVRGRISTPINDYTTNKARPVVIWETTSECKQNESCVRFCCKNVTACIDPYFFDLSSVREAKRLDAKYKVLIGKPSCNHMYIEDQAPWEFIENGTVVQFIEQTNYSNHHDTYCFERNGTSSLMYICLEDDEVDECPTTVCTVKSSYSYLMLISIPFLLVTFFVYACIPELRNLHGKSLMGYLVGLICLYLSFSLIQLNHEKLYSIGSLCTLVGYIAFVSLLVCFTWLNVMCFDIYFTFRGIQKLLTSRRSFDSSRSESKRFLTYCVYAFGVPSLITSIVYISDNTDIIPDEFKIKMGIGRCWIYKSYFIEFLYIYIPISCVIFLNTIFYAITSYKIYQVWRETSIIREADSSRHSQINKEKARFFLYLRLFIIMGVTWIIEIISWAVQNSLILHIADIFNCLQGVIIFVLFVWKPKVKRMLIRRASTFRNSAFSSKAGKSSRTESSTISTQTSQLAMKLTPITHKD